MAINILPSQVLDGLHVLLPETLHCEHFKKYRLELPSEQVQTVLIQTTLDDLIQN